MAFRALRELRTEWPTGHQFAGEEDLAASIHSDYGATIIAVNFLDFHLRLAISRRLSGTRSDAIDALFDEYKPLSNFDSKIHMAYALGIYGEKTKKILETIKHIRNTFAHSAVRISFRSPAIRDACLSIEMFPTLRRFVGTLRTARRRFLRIAHVLSLLISRQGTPWIEKPPRLKVIVQPEVIWRAPLP